MTSTSTKEAQAQEVSSSVDIDKLSVSERRDYAKAQSKLMNFGTGRYVEFSRIHAEEAIFLFRFSPFMAEKFAKNLSSDWGNAIKKAEVAGTLKRSAKNDTVTMRELSKVKDFQSTNALNIKAAIDWIAAAQKSCVAYGQTYWRLCETESMNEYITGLQETPVQ